MLMRLPETYEQLILKLEQDEETLTTRTVKTILLIEEKRKLRRSEECTSDEESRTSALISKARPKIESKQHNEKVHPSTAKKDEKKNHRCTSSTQKKKVRFFACSKIGHIAKDCDQFSDEGDDRPKRNLPQARIATQVALCAKNLATAHPYVWHLDSGATDHMTSHWTKFKDFKPCESAVETANRASMSVSGRGKVQIQLSEECGGAYVTLEDVLYVPDLNGNLLSVGRIEERGFYVTFAEGKAEVTMDTGELILTATQEGRLYSVKEATKSTMMAQTKNTALWHRRLGRLHYDAVRSLCGASEKFCEGQV
ncbi:hypothetical protein MTO96_025945 [Rhipicephalus appendiculatus]